MTIENEETGERLIDTRDMVAVHRALDGALQSSAQAITATGEGDHARAERVAAFLSDVLWLLQLHHEGEDELLYPLIVERAEGGEELVARMEEQHQGVTGGVARCRELAGRYSGTASAVDTGTLAAEVAELRARLADHVTEEETDLLPVAARVITEAEWGELPRHALSRYPGDRPWLVLGLVMEAMPPEAQAGMDEHLPPPVVGMWRGGGSAAFAEEMSFIRG